MPAGAVNASTLASDFVSGADETTFFEYDIPASLLTSGNNRIAVEVHQAQANNGDGSFDFELLALRAGRKRTRRARRLSRRADAPPTR